jgi:hypothetical protein
VNVFDGLAAYRDMMGISTCKLSTYDQSLSSPPPPPVIGGPLGEQGVFYVVEPTPHGGQISYVEEVTPEGSVFEYYTSTGVSSGGRPETKYHI